MLSCARPLVLGAAVSGVCHCEGLWAASAKAPGSCSQRTLAVKKRSSGGHAASSSGSITSKRRPPTKSASSAEKPRIGVVLWLEKKPCEAR